MPNVNILRRDPHESDDVAQLKSVPAIYVRGPWAVTPSDDPDCPGFAVTFTPSGRKAWPNRPGSASLAQAKDRVDALHSVWPHMHAGFSEIQRDRILFAVQAA